MINRGTSKNAYAAVGLAGGRFLTPNLSPRKERGVAPEWRELPLDAGEQGDRPQHGLARGVASAGIERVGDGALEHLGRHAVHAGAGGEDLGDHLFAGLTVVEHADDAANLPLDAAQPQL